MKIIYEIKDNRNINGINLIKNEDKKIDLQITQFDIESVCYSNFDETVLILMKDFLKDIVKPDFKTTIYSAKNKTSYSFEHCLEENTSVIIFKIIDSNNNEIHNYEYNLDFLKDLIKVLEII